MNKIYIEMKKVNQMANKILVVDDEEDIRMVVKEVLESAGFKADTASGGQEALKKIKKEKFDLVLIDFFMPGMSGRELLQAIRQDSKLEKTKCALLTVANFPERGLDKLKKLKIQDYIKKPFDNDDLISRVKKMIG
jgi:two-component system response regulator ResD